MKDESKEFIQSVLDWVLAIGVDTPAAENIESDKDVENCKISEVTTNGT